MSLLTRTRLLTALADAAPVMAIVAPAGWGKSALLETAAQSDLRVVQVSLASTEGHPSLLVDAFTQGLRRAYPGTAVGAVRAIAGLRTDEAPAVVLERTREALGVAQLTVAFDELEHLPRGPVFERLRQLVAARPAAVRYLFASRLPIPTELGTDLPVMGVRELALTFDEVLAVVRDGALARAILSETGGWPALVRARARASRQPTMPVRELVAALSPVVDEAIATTRSEARYVLQVAGIIGRFERSLLQAVLAGEVPGTPEARRRLMRIEPPVVARALDELVRSSLVLEDGTGFECLVGLQRTLSERLLAQDRAGWVETHRRAAELRLAALGEATPAADLVDLFAAAGERERLLEILTKHAPQLELELAGNDESARLYGWIEALEAGPMPYWCDVLAGLALARRGDAERAKERLDKAREKLAAEKKEVAHWRWQVRLAEAQALAARAKADFNEARSWLLRGLDQVTQTKKRGLAAGEEREASALELRMAIALARVSRESAGWDKTREAVTQALTLVSRAGDVAHELELRRTLIAGAFAAGDAVGLESAARAPDDLGQIARAAQALLQDANVAAAIEKLATLEHEPLALLLLARIVEPGRVRDDYLEAAAGSSEPWIAFEAELRKKRPESGLEGYCAAVSAEAQAGHPGRALELARDAYRRVGARWDEARLWLVIGQAAARRVDDGDGDADAVVRPVDGAIEAGLAAGFMLPWSIAGRGEADPERRVRTLLLAGLRGGQDKTKTACRHELERIGIDTRLVAASNERAAKPGARRAVSVGGSPFLQVTRSGTQGLSAADYQSIVNSKASSAFVVCVPDQVVLNFGRQVSLGQKRVMMPLLLHLLRNPDDSFSMLELAREIWDSPELTPTVQTKVKVAVSRLRALLGKSRNYIITTRKMEAGESVVAYQVAPQLQFQIIEPAPRD